MFLLAEGSIEPSWWLAPRASNFAEQVDSLYDFINVINIIFFVGICVAMFYFMKKYNRRDNEPVKNPVTHNTVIEITWCVIPSILLVVIFWRGFTGFIDMRVPPAETYDIDVKAKQWSWAFKYPNGAETNFLVVPKGKAVRLNITSDDVLHAVKIPAFRITQDAVPGRVTMSWFVPTVATPNDRPFHLFCAEYCGAPVPKEGEEIKSDLPETLPTLEQVSKFKVNIIGNNHSDMRTFVYVLEPAEFQKWVTDQANVWKDIGKENPADAGKILLRIKGCLGCHSTDGSAGMGPSFQGFFQRDHKFTTGESIPASDSKALGDYIRESILNPQAKFVEGFAGRNMPTFAGQVDDLQIKYITEYFKSLKR